MIKKTFEINGETVELTELTVGQMRKVKAMLKEDEFEATVLMVKFATGRQDKFVDTLTLTDIAILTEWIGSPAE